MIQSVYSLLPPTQPAPALSQPACVSETDGVSERLRCAAEIEDRERRIKVIKGRGAALIKHAAFVMTARYLLRM